MISKIIREIWRSIEPIQPKPSFRRAGIQSQETKGKPESRDWTDSKSKDSKESKSNRESRDSREKSKQGKGSSKDSVRTDSTTKCVDRSHSESGKVSNKQNN